jgi:amidohydrolase
MAGHEPADEKAPHGARAEGAHMGQPGQGVMPELDAEPMPAAEVPRANDGAALQIQLDAFLDDHEDRLIGFRRDLHMHPELGFDEHRTTKRIIEELTAVGLQPTVLPKGTGVICDIGPSDGPTVALRADIDALPLQDEKRVPYASTAARVCHACGHDVHTTVLLGAALFLARQAAEGLLPGRVRLLFQPAEEVAGGALSIMAAGGITDVDRIFALHCDPRFEVGQVGLRVGPITAACDRVSVKVTGTGGHTARPHLTGDLVYALAKIVTELPAALSRRVDPRSSLSLVWGRVVAGSVANAIPDEGLAEGTVRCLDDDAWHKAPEMMRSLLDSVAGAYDVKATSVQMVRDAASQVLGEEAVLPTPQSLGGEDFGWYLESIPGALARLGVRTPGGADYDLHRGDFDVDERSIAVGVRVMAATALTALWEGRRPAGAEPVEGAALA